MQLRNDETMKAMLETSGRCAVREMHLSDTDARVAKDLCGVDASADDRIGVDYYLERRKDDLGVGTVCEGCKAQTVPFAKNRIRDLEAEGRWDEADEYRLLAATLVRETSPGPSSG